MRAPSTVHIRLMSYRSDIGFHVERVSVPQFEENVRKNPAGPNKKTAFMGYTMATLFPNTSNSIPTNDIKVTAGSPLKRELMELMDEMQDTRAFSPRSFIDCEFEETDSSPLPSGGI